MTTSCVFIVCVCIYYIHFIYWNQSDVITVYVLRLWIPAWARNPMKFFFHPHRTVQVLFLCQVISQVKLNTWLSGDESQRIIKLCGLSRINSFHHNSHPGQKLWTGVFSEHRDKLEPARVNMTQCFSEVKKHTMNRSLIKTYHGSQFIWDVSHTVISTDALIMGHCVWMALQLPVRYRWYLTMCTSVRYHDEVLPSHFNRAHFPVTNRSKILKCYQTNGA